MPKETTIEEAIEAINKLKEFEEKNQKWTDKESELKRKIEQLKISLNDAEEELKKLQAEKIDKKKFLFGEELRKVREEKFRSQGIFKIGTDLDISDIVVKKEFGKEEQLEQVINSQAKELTR